MGVGDVYSVEAVPDCYYVDVGLYDRAEYGAVYIYDTDRPAVIDTGLGTNYELILDALKEVGIGADGLEYIIPTHIHLDHAGGAGVLAEETGADVYVYESGASFLADPARLWKGTKESVGERIRFYTEPEPIPKDRITALEDGDAIDLGGATLDVYHAPGHAFHQAFFHDAGAATVFAADAAGIYVPELDSVVETSPPPTFDREGVIDDARAIEELDPGTICYGHFGPVPADGRIDEYVEVTEAWVDAVAEARGELDGVESIVDHFVGRADTPGVWGERSAREEIEMNVEGVLRYLDGLDGE